MKAHLPTFQEVRKRHDLTLNMLIEDSQVDPRAVLLLDTWGLGEASIIESLLASLSRLAGTLYRRDLLNIGGFTFSLDPPYEQVSPEAVSKETTSWSHLGSDGSLPGPEASHSWEGKNRVSPPEARESVPRGGAGRGST